MPDVRTVLVPDGLEGERVDAGVARLFGVSRTKAADLAADGHVVIDGKAVAKSERLSAGSMLEVSLPASNRTSDTQSAHSSASDIAASVTHAAMPRAGATATTDAPVQNAPPHQKNDSAIQLTQRAENGTR